MSAQPCLLQPWHCHFLLALFREHHADCACPRGVSLGVSSAKGWSLGQVTVAGPDGAPARSCGRSKDRGHKSGEFSKIGQILWACLWAGATPPALPGPLAPPNSPCQLFIGAVDFCGSKTRETAGYVTIFQQWTILLNFPGQERNVAFSDPSPDFDP